jgi:hypothetical protein
MHCCRGAGTGVPCPHAWARTIEECIHKVEAPANKLSTTRTTQPHVPAPDMVDHWWSFTIIKKEREAYLT